MSVASDERRALIVLLGVIFLMIAGFGLTGGALRRRRIGAPLRVRA